jgi:hypothetical protein
VERRTKDGNQLLHFIIRSLFTWKKQKLVGREKKEIVSRRSNISTQPLFGPSERFVVAVTHQKRKLN